MRIAMLALLVLSAASCKKPQPAETASQKPSLGAADNPQPSLTPPGPNQEQSKTDKDIKLVVATIREAMNNANKMAELVQETDKPVVRKITYAHLKKSPDKYYMNVYRISGRVLEISEKNGNDFARIGTGYSGANVFYVIALGPSDFVAGDWVDAVGVITGQFSYKSTAGWDITIPEMVTAPLMKRGTIVKYLAKDKPPRDDEDE